MSCLTVWPVGSIDCGTARARAAGNTERRVKKCMVDVVCDGGADGVLDLE